MATLQWEPSAEAGPGDENSGRVIGVACSGGRDSMALLHCSARHAATVGVSVVALHVNHGLMPQADDWQRHVQLQCADWANAGLPVQFRCERIAERPAAGDSIEAWARRVRYEALRRMARAAGCTAVLLAHHRRDQAETFLLQALRGAGVGGLAAMPAAAERDTVHWLRPWLRHPRRAIDAYLEQHRLSPVDDPSNADPRHARSRLRTEVWPVLLAAFPHAEQVLVDSASRAADAAQCLAEIAGDDLDRLVGADGELLIPPWHALSAARRRNALRFWLQRGADRPAPAALVERLLAETAGGARPQRGGRQWEWGTWCLHLHGGSLWMRERPVVASVEPIAREAALRVDSPGRYALPGWRATLVVEPVERDGIPLDRLARIDVRCRTGAEQFQSGARRPPRSLKKQFQSAGIAAWQRGGALLYSAGELIFVAGLGIDARALASDGKDLVRLRWETDAQDIAQA